LQAEGLGDPHSLDLSLEADTLLVAFAWTLNNLPVHSAEFVERMLGPGSVVVVEDVGIEVGVGDAAIRALEVRDQNQGTITRSSLVRGSIKLVEDNLSDGGAARIEQHLQVEFGAALAFAEREQLRSGTRLMDDGLRAGCPGLERCHQASAGKARRLSCQR